MSLNLDYYYGNEAELYSFYRIPKVLFTDHRFKTVSVEAKVLYGLLLDRMALSIKNRWLDEDGRVFIIYTISDVMETLCCAEQKANKLLSELDSTKGVGLIERKRRGLGKPNIIYIKNFIEKAQNQTCENHNSENIVSEFQEIQKAQNQICENHNLENAIFTSQELRISQGNNTDSSYTDFSDTDLSIYPIMEEKHLPKKLDKIEMIESCREQVKKNIEYEILLHDNPHEEESINGMVELMVEAICSDKKTLRINQEDMPIQIVKSRLLTLDNQHIQYVMESLSKNTKKVGNIRSYNLTALYNAPVTMSSYYTNLVSHDMASSRI